MKKKHFKKILSFTTAFFLACTSIPFGFASKVNAVEVKAESVRTIDPFDINELTMNDSYCKNSFSKEVSYLLSFDTNRLLAGFRENAGLNTYGAKRYDGWEGCLIAGHTLGHYLTALAQAYNNPNISSSDKSKVYNSIKILIDGLLQCQQNSKGKPGLIWGAPKVGSGVETQFDNVEHNKTNIINESWVPWYTIHKILNGLVDVYNLTNYENAKVVASGLGDWTYNRANSWNSQTRRQVLNVEYGGMNDCLYELYKITGKSAHLDVAHKFDDEDLFKRVSQGAQNSLNNMHANTTIPKFIGALKRYTTLKGSGDSANYLKYAEVFWDTVVNRHTYVTGGNSEWEHFGLDNVLDKERTNCNCETCNVYNMLKLSRELFMITGDAKYMNYYENAYYNSILSSQNPETGMTTYFQPMASGYFKTFSTPFNNFWCCTGTGLENFTKLGDTNYMHKGNTLYVNMYQSSSISWKDQGVTIVQKTNIPESDTASFTINADKPALLNLKFRIPDWCLGTMSIQKNDKTVTYTTEKGYAVVSDTFKNGDVITVKIPLGAVAYSLPDNNNSIAFKYGPLVLSAELGTSNMTLSSTGMNVTIPKNKVISSETVNLDPAYGSVASYMKNINKYLVKSGTGLQFKLTGADQNLTFSPHYKQYKQRYAIYLNYKSSGSTSVDPKDQASTDIIDTVQPGYGQYESDDLHAMLDNNSVGITNDGTYRYAKANGSFAYRMAVDENAKFKYLGVTFRKADNGKSIKIKVGKYVVYSKTLNYTGNSDSYKVNIMIPDDVIANSLSSVTIDEKKYNTVTVTFSSNDSKDSARVCDFVYMTAVKPNYKVDSSLAYYVNCGDHDTTTPSGSDGLGIFNSVTEQLYKADAVTGFNWGIVDDATDKYNGSSKSAGIYTANTWPDEFNTQDDSNKSTSYRYTKNQYENKIDRHLDYNFELPNGTYDVEIGLANPWKCSESPTIYSNYGETNQSVIAENIKVGSKATVKGNVKVTDGKLTINVKTSDKAINLTYILIKIDKMDALKVEPDTVEIGSSTKPNPDKTPVIADGWYYIKNVNADKYLTVTDNKANSGANVEISSGAEADGQKWKVTNQSDGYITLTSALGNFMLDVSKASPEDRANITIYNAHSGTAQRFKVQSTATENVFTIATKASDGSKVLDVSGKGKNDGSNVIQYTLTGDTNQQFVFEPIKETTPTEPTEPKEGLKATYTINNWGSGYNVSFKITNNGPKVNTWTLKINKSDINIESSWNVDVKDSGLYYLITPLSWNSTLDTGESVEFGINGKGSIGSIIPCSVK